MTDKTRSDIAHLFRRAGFGASPDQLDEAVRHGYRATVESLLAGLQGPDPGGDKSVPPTLTSPYRPPGTTPSDPTAKLAFNRLRRQQQVQQYVALQQWWLDRMIATSTPLREKMTLLWHGHFATGFEKVANAGLMYRQNQLLRTMAGGSFEALTQAVAKDPAMMLWLDTETNAASHPNENFARELMELFTLGIGNYREDDVRAAARCFTGWSFNPRTDAYVFMPRRHDDGTKTLLGQTGNLSGEGAIATIVQQPASSKFVVAKLWSHLAYPLEASDAIAVELAAGFAKDLDITNLLRAIFLHPAFAGPRARGGLAKQPIEYLVGAARAFGLTAELHPATGSPGPAGGSGQKRPGVTLRTFCTSLGQEPFNPPNVGGWPQNEYWLTTATSLARLQFGLASAQRVDLSWLSGLPVGQRADAVARRLSIDGWGPTSAAALNHVASKPSALVGLALSAPEYVLN